jgi:hypothetical protein
MKKMEDYNEKCHGGYKQTQEETSAETVPSRAIVVTPECSENWKSWDRTVKKEFGFRLLGQRSTLSMESRAWLMRKLASFS